MRRTMYDAALARFPLDEMSAEALRLAKNRYRRERAASRTKGRAGGAHARTPRASKTYGPAGVLSAAGLGDPMSGDDEDVVGSMSQEQLDAQRRQLREFERQQMGRASQSTRVGDWRANYVAEGPDEECGEGAGASSGAEGRAAGRGRSLLRSEGALASTAAPRDSPRSPALGRTAGDDGSEPQGFTVVEHRSRSRRGKHASGTHGTAGVAAPARPRSRSLRWPPRPVCRGPTGRAS